MAAPLTVLNLILHALPIPFFFNCKILLIYQNRAIKIGFSSLKSECQGGQKTALWGSKKRIIVYAGQYYDSETGLHYNYHRYYDPSLGRYLRADPIGLVGGINLYAYVQANPLNAIDPYGLDSLAPVSPYAPPVMGHPVFQSGTPTNDIIVEDTKKWFSPQNLKNVLLFGLSFSDPSLLMAKGGKQNIDNEYVRDVQNQGIQDPCTYLRQLYNNTCDKKKRRKIKQAMKRFNCDGKDRFE